jgi:cytochrome c-type biogenesis protein CcsB
MAVFLENFDQQFANLGTVSLFFNAIFCWVQLITRTKRIVMITKLTTIASSFFIGFSLLYRWYQAGYFPLSNLYESLLFLSWCLINGYLFIEHKSKSRIVGLLITPIALLIAGFASLILPTDMQKALPLVPALQSNWLMMHVSMMMVSYATLILGSLLSIFYLVVSKRFALAFSDSIFQNTNTKKDLFLTNLDLWSYRTIGFGFPLLTIGIIAGAVWANEAWGSYWSWDPKETWALITWLIFAAYLHARILRGWEGQKAALLGSIGFVVVWVCYLGVNFLGKGLHSYGWILDK